MVLCQQGREVRWRGALLAEAWVQADALPSSARLVFVAQAMRHNGSSVYDVESANTNLTTKNTKLKTKSREGLT